MRNLLSQVQLMRRQICPIFEDHVIFAPLRSAKDVLSNMEGAMQFD